METPESMQQLEDLFHEALGLERAPRAEFIAQIRSSNPNLGAAVESLIAAHESTGSPIDSPAIEAAAELIADTQPALVSGQVVGHYRIIKPIGKGGMGEVYLASDTKLDRHVALKLLPAEFTNHKERLRRFILEAKAASSLNHPNIITIHEIGVTDGAHFIATEFIDGQTLAQRMSHARLELPEVLDVAIQAASALQAAHTAGIVHRDIKPENIMVRPDGYVKVLDFGLAKLTETEKPTSVASEIDTIVKNDTKPGTVLGTVNYMSPEQARGHVLDQRTDIFSLGIVLYEMAAGRKPFIGATNVDTLVSILEKDPPLLIQFAPGAPAEFQRIVSKALRKNREQRYQTIKDLLIDLKSFREDLSFQEKLERTSEANAAVTPATVEATATNGTAPIAAAVQTNQTSVTHSRRPVIITLLLVLFAAAIGGAAMIYRSSRSTPVTPTPPTVVQRTVSYWITVQKYRDGKPYQDPFRLRDDINFEKDYQLRLNITSPESGRLYLLNEGPAGADPIPTFNVMFPTTTTNKGSAILTQNQQIQIPEDSWFDFDGQEGTEKIWLVWAPQDVPELEGVKAFANKKDRGVISSPGLRAAVQQFLKSHSSTTTAVERDEAKKETVVKANSEILVHVIKLEHH